MDRLAFFKQGLSSVMDAATSLVGLKKAVDSFTDVVDEALSEVSAGMGLSLPAFDASIYDGAEFALSQFATMGYTNVECGRYLSGSVHDIKCDEFYALATKKGLKIIGGHLNKVYKPVAMSESEVVSPEGAANASEVQSPASQHDEWWQKALDDHRAMHCQYVVMSEGPVEFADEELTQWAEYFNHVGEMALQRELKFCFHPKAELLKPRKEYDNRSVFDVLAERCDAEKVWFVIDTYECECAGVDTCAVMTAFGRRIYLLHMHDYGIACESEKIDFEAVANLARKEGIDNMVVEMHTFSLPPMNCAERSLFNLEALPSIRY